MELHQGGPGNFDRCAWPKTFGRNPLNGPGTDLPLRANLRRKSPKVPEAQRTIAGSLAIRLERIVPASLQRARGTDGLAWQERFSIFEA